MHPSTHHRGRYARKDLVSKITSIAEKFAPSSMWFLQTMTEVAAPSLRTAALAGTRDGLPHCALRRPSHSRDRPAPIGVSALTGEQLGLGPGGSCSK